MGSLLFINFDHENIITLRVFNIVYNVKKTRLVQFFRRYCRFPSPYQSSMGYKNTTAVYPQTNGLKLVLNWLQSCVQLMRKWRLF